MPATLQSIVSAARERVAQQRNIVDWAELERRAAEHQPRGFRQKLAQRAHDGIAIIAELKKASPSKGVIRAEFRAAELAQ